jgi:hypothetical protein
MAENRVRRQFALDNNACYSDGSAIDETGRFLGIDNVRSQ